MKELLDDIINRKNQLLNGILNCVPYSIHVLNRVMYGIERGKYWVVTANTKVGKTQLTDFLFTYNLLNFLYQYNSTLGFNIKIKYLCLEESKLEKQYRLLCHFLNLGVKESERVTIEQLRSLQTPLSDTIIEKISKHSNILEFFNNTVEYIETVSTANDIINYIKNLALKEGIYDNETGVYTRHNPKDIIIVIIDNYNLMLTDSFTKSITDSINKLSSFIVSIKKITDFSFVAVQQQAAAAENIAALQFRDGIPTLDNLADSKQPGRDANFVFGLYSPYRNKIINHQGLNIAKLEDKYRALYILADRDYGNTGEFIRLFFDGSYTYFTELKNI